MERLLLDQTVPDEPQSESLRVQELDRAEGRCAFIQLKPVLIFGAGIAAKNVCGSGAVKLEADLLFRVGVVARYDLRLNKEVKELANLCGVRDCDGVAIERELEGGWRGFGECGENTHLLLAKRPLGVLPEEELEERSCHSEDGHANEYGGYIKWRCAPAWGQRCLPSVAYTLAKALMAA